jgi:hypothetical protein
MKEFRYHLCPKCARAVPSATQEKYCPNDGEKMLECCPVCETKIRSPYARHCGGCGLEFRQVVSTQHAQQLT